MALVVPFDSMMDVQSLKDAAGTVPPDLKNAASNPPRYPASDLVFLAATTLGASSVFAPSRGAARLFDIKGKTLIQDDSLDTLLEFEPIPFGHRDVFGALPAGMPTFYIAFNRADVGLGDNDVVDFGEKFFKPGAPLLRFSGKDQPCRLGAIFQRRVNLSPASWIASFAAAVHPVDTGAADGWLTLAGSRYKKSSCRLLSAQGAPLSGVTVMVRSVKDADGTATTWKEITIADGNKLADLGDTVLPQRGFTTEISIKKVKEPYLPVICVFEDGQSTKPAESLVLRPLSDPNAARHLLVTDLAQWFAPNRQSTDKTIRYHLGNRVEPLIDGNAAFRALVSDLMAIDGAGQGAHFAGWDFGDFKMVSGLKEAGSTVDVDTSLAGLAKRIRASGGDVRVLANKLLTVDVDKLNSFSDQVALGIGLASIVAGVAGYFIFTRVARKNVYNTAEFLAVGGGLLALEGGLALWQVLDQNLVPWILDIEVNKNKHIIDQINQLAPNRATFSAHPARFEDNPLFDPTKPSVLSLILSAQVGDKRFNLTDIIPFVGTWHAKTQLVKRSPDPRIAPLSGPTPRKADYVAFLGGIDIASNRVDGPGHQGRPLETENWENTQHPFHDVHVRLVGPAAFDVFKYWDDRWSTEKKVQSALPKPIDLPGPGFTLPDPVKDFPENSARHIVQIGLTSFMAKDGSAATGLEPNTTIFDTLVRAISSAREYIYIEDQYFTPSWSKDATAAGFVDALLDAADHAQRLVVLVPIATDQLFGNIQRRAIFAALRSKWGKRVQIGVPMRRPVLPTPRIVPNQGRCVLRAKLNGTDDTPTLELGPIQQVPSKTPFWIWINGELMYSFQQADTDDTSDVVRVKTWRGRYGTKLREHGAGSAVTTSLMKGIYVHAKVTLIDDVFVSIGSANCNRRGHFLDGEIAAFTVPQELKAAKDNPARALRTALWAEHLGLTPTMGPVLLEDPLQAYELFKRSFFEGNRFVPFELMDPEREVEYALRAFSLDADRIIGAVLKELASIGKTLVAPESWNFISDPTGSGDPKPTFGPVTP